MSMESEETVVVRTLALDGRPSAPVAPQFDWRVDLSDRTEAEIRQKVADALMSAGLEHAPTVAIVRRIGLSLADETIEIDIRNHSGKKLCDLSIADNGFGMLRLLICD